MNGKNLFFGALVALLVTVSASADVVSYNIDVSATDDGGSGNTLRVFGTLDIDVDIADTSSAVQAHNLFMQVNSDSPIALGTLFNGGGADIDFVDVGGNLFVQVTNSNDQEIVWESAGFTESFFIGSGPTEAEVAAFSPSGSWEQGIPGGNGFLLGTAIPEPSSAIVFLGALCGLINLRRKRS